MAVTLKEVAIRSGFSIRTVSRTLNGLGNVSEQTRQKVHAAAEELGYRPSLLARALVTRHSRTLGLVIPHLTNPFFTELAQGVFDTAHQQGYNVLMNHCRWNIEPEMESWQALGDRAVEGLITDLQYGHEANLLQYSKVLKPIVVFQKDIVYPGISTVKADIAQGARQAVEYLIGRGHRQIALLVVDVQPHEAVERLTAYHAVMAEHNLEETIQYLAPGWIEPDIPSGRQAALRLLEEHPKVTAIFCYNDLLAIGALQACKQLGRAVPEDVAVIGFDDIPFASLVQPSLSTVHMDKYGLGSQAVLRLLEMLENPGQMFEPRILQSELLLRESA